MTRFNFTIQDASPLISYTGGLWFEGNSGNDSDAALYDGSFKVTQVVHAVAKLQFVGTGVSVFGAKRENHGNYSVDLDDTGNPGSYNGTGYAFQVDLWHAYNLTNGSHTIKVTNEPISAELSFFDVDFLSIERVIGQDGDTIFNSTIDDTAPNVHYDPSWAPDFVWQDRNGNNTLHSTTTPNSTVEITFQGCCIEIYGLYTNAAYNVSLDKQPPVYLQGVDVDLETKEWHPQTLLYLKDGLPEIQHTVSLKAIVTNDRRPFSFDYAVVRSTGKLSDCKSSNSARLLAMGISVGSVLVLGLIIAAYLLRRRRRRRRHQLSRDFLMAEPDPYPAAYVPVPWITLKPRSVTAPRTDSTFQFSSVISVWRYQSEYGESTQSGSRSTHPGSSSASTGSRRI